MSLRHLISMVQNTKNGESCCRHQKTQQKRLQKVYTVLKKGVAMGEPRNTRDRK